MRRMYTDTVSPHSAGIKFAIDYYGIDHVMYGTDYPCWDPKPCLELIDEIPLSAADKRGLAYLRHAPSTRPHFLAYSVRDLPAAMPLVARRLFGRPLLTWTVRTADDRAAAQRYADQMIFEGFRP